MLRNAQCSIRGQCQCHLWLMGLVRCHGDCRLGVCRPRAGGARALQALVVDAEAKLAEGCGATVSSHREMATAVRLARSTGVRSGPLDAIALGCARRTSRRSAYSCDGVVPAAAPRHDATSREGLCLKAVAAAAVECRDDCGSRGGRFAPASPGPGRTHDLGASVASPADPSRTTQFLAGSSGGPCIGARPSARRLHRRRRPALRRPRRPRVVVCIITGEPFRASLASDAHSESSPAFEELGDCVGPGRRRTK
mmetsp:Transcript_14686/g.58706  ORF Transcript_14686/g.58706 Transcript_14686/m.58706 type:complete len:253 (+) Transcript_14686:133-891(+)